MAESALWSDISAEHVLTVEDRPNSSNADPDNEVDNEVDDSEIDEEEEDGLDSPSAPRKRRTRRRKRHGKGKAGASATTSTGTPGSGGNSHSEDELAGVLSSRQRRGAPRGSRAVVTWGDLGLGASFGGSAKWCSAKGSALRQANPPMLAHCEMPGPPPPPPNPPPAVGVFSDASERAVPPALAPGQQQQQEQWLGCGEPSLCLPAGWEGGDSFAFQGEVAMTEQFGFPVQCSAPCSPCSMPPSTTLYPIAGLASYPCSPTGAGTAAPIPPAPAASPSGPTALPSWLLGNPEPICAEDLAEKLRSMAQETYED